MAFTHLRKGALKRALLGLSLLLLLGVKATVSHCQAHSTELYLSPEAVLVTAGQTVSFSLQVEGADSLCRAELHLNYDPGLDVQDADPNRAGTQIEAGEVFGGCIQWNEVDGGQIHFVAQRDPDVGSFSGNGEIARITVVVDTSTPGGYLLSFNRTAIRLLDCDGHPLDVLHADDAVLVIPTTVTGNVTRDGWSTYAGATVSATLYRTGSGLAVADGHVTTDASGDFRLQTWEVPPTTASPSASPPPGCSAGWVYVRLDYPNYLAECYQECAASDLVDIGPHQLEGGDVNRDGCINISDIVLIISEYGEASEPPCYATGTGQPDTAPSGDINGDCQVNILDLTQAAGNFGLCSNCP